MNDQDLIQRNQIIMMRALARIISDLMGGNNQNVLCRNDLLAASKETEDHLDWKLNPAKATETNPWPKDLGEES